MVYATGALLDGLLTIASDRDPDDVSIALATTDARDLDVDLAPDTRVLTDFYFPDTGDSVSAVFGVDLSTPGSAGRFVSHPDGDHRLSKTDDLHGVVLVAVPPWDRESVRAYDRRGREQELRTLEVVPEDLTLPDAP